MIDTNQDKSKRLESLYALRDQHRADIYNITCLTQTDRAKVAKLYRSLDTLLIQINNILNEAP